MYLPNSLSSWSHRVDEGSQLATEHEEYIKLDPNKTLQIFNCVHGLRLCYDKYIQTLNFSVRVNEPRVVLSEFLGLLFSHAMDLVVLFAVELPLVLAAEPRPECEVNHGRHGYHGHGDSVTFHEPRLVVVRV